MGRKKRLRMANPSDKRGIVWPRWTGFRGMTLRDWLGLIVVPLIAGLVVVGLTAWFNEQQNDRQQRLEDQRAEAEQELAEQSAQDEALQDYLDQVGTLLLEKDLRNSEVDSEVRTLAQARTLTVLRRLDPARKAAVMQFLVEAQLIQSVEGRPPIIVLDGADLSGTSVPGAETLRGRALNITTLYHFHGASLVAADLSHANLSDTDLSDALLLGADLSNTNLSNTNLSDAFLLGANLRDTDFSGADLSNAYLKGAHGTDYEELAQQAKSLEGATMPNGQKYEDWLKDKESRGKDGEHNGAS